MGGVTSNAGSQPMTRSQAPYPGGAAQLAGMTGGYGGFSDAPSGPRYSPQQMAALTGPTVGPGGPNAPGGAYMPPQGGGPTMDGFGMGGFGPRLSAMNMMSGGGGGFGSILQQLLGSGFRQGGAPQAPFNYQARMGFAMPAPGQFDHLRAGPIGGVAPPPAAPGQGPMMGGMRPGVAPPPGTLNMEALARLKADKTTL